LHRSYIRLLIGIFSITILLSGCYNNSVNRKIPDTNQLSENTVQANPARISANQPASTEEPMASGPVKTVPWEKDSNFLSKQKEANAIVQMAAFQTVLHDPLPGEEENVHLAARLVSGTILQPGQTFSQNQSIGPYTRERGFKKGPMYLGSQLKSTIGGGVCKMASTLYNVTVLCNLPVVERYSHGMPVPYVPYGQDATVSYGDKDFRFKNTQPYPILIWAQGVDNILYVAFYGQSEPPNVEWHHQFSNQQAAPKIYRKNSSIPAGQEKIVVQGMDGATVKSWVTIINPDGTSSTKQLNTSYYSPMPYIIEKGSVTSASQ
jgi:vancomycin resistance protein YoaR